MLDANPIAKSAPTVELVTLSVGLAPREGVLVDSLPRLCLVCCRPGEHRHELRFLGPLPRFFWWAMLGTPLLFGSLLLVVLYDPTAAPLFGRGSALVGSALAMWTSRGAFRRTRNWLIFWFCRDHDPDFRRLARTQAVARGVMIALLILSLLSIPLIGAVLLDDRPGSSPGRLAKAAAIPAILAVAIIIHARVKRRARRYMGLAPRLSRDQFDPHRCALTLACHNPDFAQAVREVHAAQTN
jgi:hypothetical protein